MNRLQIIKRTLLSYVNAVKFIWSELAHPLTIIGKKFMNLRDYKIYGNSVEEPVNLVDLSTCIYGVYIDDTGIEASTTNISFGLTDYINIDTNETYNVSTVGNVRNTVRINFYDADKNWLSQYSMGVIDANNTFTATIDMVENTAYIRVSGILTVLKVYHPKSVDHPVEIKSVGDLTTKNLCPNDWEQGWISATTGANSGGSQYIRTKDYFTLDSSKIYFISSEDIGEKESENPATITWFFYDENKSFIGCFVSYKNRTISGLVDAGVDIPEGTVFYRIVVLSTNINIRVQIEEGSTATEYEPYHKYKIPVRARGKNLLDVKKIYPAISNDEGGATCDNTKIGEISNNMLSKYKEFTQYTLSYEYEVTSYEATSLAYPVAYYTDGTLSAKWGATGGTTTGTRSGKVFFTTQKGKTVKRIILGYSTSQKQSEVKVTNMQLEEGTVETEYEPYTEPQTFNIYLDEPLSYAENVGSTYANKYSNYIDFNTQTLYTETIKIILTGDEPWKVRTNCTNAFYYNLGKIIDGGFCTHYPTLKSSAIDNQSSVYIFNTSVIIITDLNYDNVDDFKAFLKNEYEAGRPVTIVCGLYDLQNEEYINLPELPQFKGTTIYEVDTNVEPSGMEVKYC